MKNKILICLLVLSISLVLVGCGKKEEKENNINLVTFKLVFIYKIFSKSA